MTELVREENYERLMRKIVEPGLAAMREEIDMPLSGGGTLRAEVYNRLDATRAVVILHGYTESAEKFREMAWYFIHAGFSVFAMDHRGHGRSVRALEDTSITHVEHFEDYLHDLEEFMEKVVRPRMQGGTLCLYAHSMGGAVGAFALMEHPDWFARAVLTAPMIAPVSKPLTPGLARAVTGAMCALGQGKRRAFIGKPFDPASETLETSCSTSRARFDYYERKRVENRHLQNCSPTYGWVREAVSVTRKLLDPQNDAKIVTPLLLCQAGLDTIVCLPEQEQFVAQVKGARLIRYETARHEIYNSTDDVMERYVDDVIGFLSE